MFPFYLLKIRENQRFSGVFRAYKMGALARNGWPALARNGISIGLVPGISRTFVENRLNLPAFLEFLYLWQMF